MDGKSPVDLTTGFDYSSGLRRTDDYDLLAADIQEKSAKEVKKYYLVFKKKWKQLAGAYLLLMSLIIELSGFTAPSVPQNRTAYRRRRSEA